MPLCDRDSWGRICVRPEIHGGYMRVTNGECGRVCVCRCTCVIVNVSCWGVSMAGVCAGVHV